MAPTATGNKARWAPRPGVYGLELSRSVRRVQRRGHIVAASRLQFVIMLPPHRAEALSDAFV